MAEETVLPNIGSPPGPPPQARSEDAKFERDLQEMLDDGPSLNDVTSNVQELPNMFLQESTLGGTPNSVSTNFAENVPPFSAGASAESSTTAGPGGIYGTSVAGSSSRLNQGLTRSFTVPPEKHQLNKNVNRIEQDLVPLTSKYATSNVPLGSVSSGGSVGNSPNGDFVPKTMGQVASSKIEVVKDWSLNTFKMTKQFISERLGKTSKTVDLEMEASIETLRDTQRRYAHVLRLARAMASHFANMVHTQRALGESFSELAQKTPDLQEQFVYNCETQRTLVKNGEILLSALNFFISSLNTLIHKTMEDSLLTVKNYESARLEYDAYRADFEGVQTGPRENATSSRVQESQRKFMEHKMKFERLRGDVQIKLKFLDENKVKVMHKQLLLFHNAISAYFSGNATALEATLKQFNIQLKRPNAEKPSWIES